MNCKFCGKECKNKNSLKQHEIRCNKNPNKIKVVTPAWPKGKSRESSTKGRIWITNGNSNKMVYPSDFETYYKHNGWIKGVNEEYKKIVSKSTSGKASSFEKEELRRKKISETMSKNPDAGGYRKGSGRGKQGWYKGIYCDSSWELAFVYYHLENNLKIERCKEIRKYIYNGKEHKYLPDFITKDGIFEIKGFSTEQSKEKSKQNPDIRVLYYNDVKPYLEFVESKIGNKFYEKLYE